VSNYPPGFSWTAFDRAWGAAPDEPDHPTHCGCGKFLRRWGWEYEADTDGEDRWVNWATRCRACGGFTAHREWR
jgi:hypothetical protein